MTKKEEVNPPLVSIVILCWNRKEDIAIGLKKIEEDNYINKEIIVVDNGSTDGSPELITKEFPNVKLIKFPENVGIYAYNIGFETAKGKYILILDDDSYPIENSIEKAIEELEKNSRLGCIAFQIVNPNNQIQWPEENIDQQFLTHHFIGCGAMIRKDLFKKIGYYPKDYFLMHNELAVGLKLLNEGYNIKYLPKIKAFHKSPPNKRMNSKRIYFLVRNGSWNAWQFIPWKYLLFYYPSFVIYNLYISIKYNAFAGFCKGLFTAHLKIYTYLIKKREKCLKEEWVNYLKRRMKI